MRNVFTESERYAAASVDDIKAGQSGKGGRIAPAPLNDGGEGQGTTAASDRRNGPAVVTDNPSSNSRHQQVFPYVHPFDHPLLWDGHATLVDEVVARGVAFDCGVTNVGGGLLVGIVAGLRRNGLAQVPVIAAETEGAASVHASVAAGEPVTLPAIASIACPVGRGGSHDTPSTSRRSPPSRAWP